MLYRKGHAVLLIELEETPESTFLLFPISIPALLKVLDTPLHTSESKCDLD